VEGAGMTPVSGHERGRWMTSFFPVELLVHVPASGIPYASGGFRWCQEPKVASRSAELTAGACGEGRGGAVDCGAGLVAAWA